MAIGFDCDEVLLPTLKHHCNFLNKKYGVDLKEQDFKKYEFWEYCGVTREQSIIDFSEFFETQEFQQIQPFPGVVSGIEKLSKIKKLFVITSRLYSYEQFTRKWIEQYFPGRFSGVAFGNHYSLNGKSIEKLELCKKRGVEVLVEDNEMHASAVCKEIPVVLFDKPWNQQIKDTKMLKRAMNWEEIVCHVREFLNSSSQS